MKLSSELLRQLDNPVLGEVDRARRQFELSKKFEEAGDYEAAREALEKIRQGVGMRPRLEGLRDESTIGEVLLRVGALTGWIGSSEQIRGRRKRLRIC